MSDEKNQEGSVDEGTAQRLAEQRKALNLQTRPLEVIADLDWDVDDDDAVFALPTPAATPKPAAAKPAVEPAKPAEEPAVSSSGTMMMSAGDFRAALQEESAKVEANAQETATAVEEPATTNVETAQDEVDEVAQAAAVRGGTMLLSGAEMQDAMAAAKIDVVDTGAEAKVTAPNKPLEGADEIADSAPHQSAGGTMLMSSAAIHAQLEEEADMRNTQQAPAAHDTSPTQDLGQQSVQHAPVEPQAPEWSQAPQRQEAVWGNPDELETQQQRHLPTQHNKRTVMLIALGVAVLIILLILLLK